MSTVNVSRLPVTVFVITVLLAAAMGVTGVSAQTADGEVAVSPTETSLGEGKSQTIAVAYERKSDATPQGIEYTLTYDPDVISVIDQEQGSYLGGTAFVNSVSTPGEIEYAEAILDGDGVETANGTVATITVEAASDIDGETTTSLEFTTAKASEGATEFTIATTNGTVEAEVPNQADDATDDDSGSEETTDENTDSDETTEDTDAEGATDDTEADSNRTEDVNNSTAESETRAEAELNETNTEPSDSSPSTQPANDSSTGNGTASEGDTDSAVPGFGVTLTLIAVLAVSYIIGRKSS